MKAYVVAYRIAGKDQNFTFQVDAKDRDSATRKTKRVQAKLWKVSENMVKVTSLTVVGYY